MKMKRNIAKFMIAAAAVGTAAIGLKAATTSAVSATEFTIDTACANGTITYQEAKTGYAYGDMDLGGGFTLYNVQDGTTTTGKAKAGEKAYTFGSETTSLTKYMQIGSSSAYIRFTVEEAAVVNIYATQTNDANTTQLAIKNSTGTIGTYVPDAKADTVAGKSIISCYLPAAGEYSFGYGSLNIYAANITAPKDADLCSATVNLQNSTVGTAVRAYATVTADAADVTKLEFVFNNGTDDATITCTDGYSSLNAGYGASAVTAADGQFISAAYVNDIPTGITVSFVKLVITFTDGSTKTINSL